jgi:hypothetical protein
MKDKYVTFLVYGILLLSVVFGIVFFFSSKNTGPAQTTAPNNEAVEQLSPADSLVPPKQINPIDISIEGAGTRTVKLSWDDSKADVFRIVLFDADLLQSKPEKSAIWAIVSLKTIPTDGSAVDLTRDNMAGFIPSGYTIGERILGFIHEPEPSFNALKVFSLVQGREYILQLNGLKAAGAEDGQILMNKTFTFTNSCLPPDCLSAGDVPEGHK